MPFDLHRQLQEWYAANGGVLEVPFNGGFVADVLRHGVIYEIQTRALRHIRSKIASLLEEWPVVVVLPIARNTTIIQHTGNPLVECGRRSSPKHGTPLDAFAEAVSLAKLLAHQNLALEIALVDVEEFRVKRTGEEQERLRKRRRRWRNRRGLEWATTNRRLVAVHETIRLDTPTDGLRLLPDALPNPFTVRMLSDVSGLSRWRAGQIAYTLRHLGALTVSTRTKDGLWYTPTVERAAEPTFPSGS